MKKFKSFLNMKEIAYLLKFNCAKLRIYDEFSASQIYSCIDEPTLVQSTESSFHKRQIQVTFLTA